MSNWVYDRDEIGVMNRTGSCVCESGDASGNEGSFRDDWSILGHIQCRTCRVCRRWYLLDDGDVVHPDTVLKTTEEGVVTVSERNIEAFEFLIRSGGIAVLDELWETPAPLDPAADAVLYADAGMYVAALYYGTTLNSIPSARALAVDDRKRREGYATELVTQWFEARPEETLRVWATTEQGKQFFEGLDIETAILGNNSGSE